MHPQLEAVAEELREASERLERLAGETPDELWAARPGPGRWSAAESVAHLNLTWAAFAPRLAAGLQEARASGRPAARRFRRNAAGWLIWKAVSPRGRIRVKTSEAFVPDEGPNPKAVRRAFRDGQAALAEMLREADGLDLEKVRIASPFDPRFRYNLYASFTILARHQHRHLAQAEEAVAAARSAPP